jgi:hypothetical protein
MVFRTTPFSTKIAIFNLAPELLTFNNWVLIHEKSFFFNFSPGSVASEPLDFGAIYKTVIGFQFNQFSL